MIKFTKMTGIGNDYVYINCITNDKFSENNESEIKELLENIEIVTKRLSNRNFGIGSDGVVLICNSNVADFKMRIFNSDGSEARMCGNGIRCVAKYVFDNKFLLKKDFTIETLSGIKKVKLFCEENSEICTNVEVDMGIPKINKEDVSVSLNNNEIIKNLKIDIENGNYDFFVVGIGNTHAVCFVNDVDNFDVEKYGKIVENYNLFPNRVNVEFVQILDKENIKVRAWERGSGETMACGTGACASVIASVKNSLTSNNVTVMLQGGTLNIRYDKDNHIYMKGSAVTIFNGKYLLETFLN